MSSETSGRSEAHAPAISVRGVSKRYRLHAGPFARLRAALGDGPDDPHGLWALRNVNLELRAGEALGVVGRNGAGKSTLLQILCGALRPTEGEVEIRGRVAPLLQLAAGFHPDFTGRENVFLCGSVMGLRRAELVEHLDEIEAFADIGRHIDQPVRTYSRGMNARLGFAIAMSVRPDILVVDEVLAVGDLLFQQKCITRIQQLRDEGMTLVLVSHSPDRVRALCDQGLLLREGTQRFFGSAGDCVDLYLKELRMEAQPADAAPAAAETPSESRVVRQQTRGTLRYGTQQVRIVDVRVLNAEGDDAGEIPFGEPVEVEVTYESAIEAKWLNVSFLVRDETGIDLTGSMTHDEGLELPEASPGDRQRVRFRFRNRLRPGLFGLSVAITQIPPDSPREPVLHDQIDGVQGFRVPHSTERPVHYKFDSEVEAWLP